jgi:hypothetical protein
MRLLVILIISAYLCATTQLGELFKIPVLIEHYNEHKALDERISFWNYLKDHYADEGQHADYERDMQLPFKTLIHSHLVHTAVVLPAFQPFIAVAHIIYTDKRQQLFAHTSVFSSNYLSAIWQPPRVSTSL